jgi:2-C-methyl-D-erythritol 2,4-cyclodiphosphate synthase
VRVGLGYDVHPLVEGRALVLGGVTVEYPRGLEGHSDGDVLCHALIDALLGATARGDIGAWFPSTDERNRGASSVELLAWVQEQLANEGWHVLNVDATIVAEQPRLASCIAAMRERVADVLGVKVRQVSIKTTTTDRLGSIGRGEGIAAQAVALVEWRPTPSLAAAIEP